MTGPHREWTITTRDISQQLKHVNVLRENTYYINPLFILLAPPPTTPPPTTTTTTPTTTTPATTTPITTTPTTPLPTTTTTTRPPRPTYPPYPTATEPPEPTEPQTSTAPLDRFIVYMYVTGPSDRVCRIMIYVLRGELSYYFSTKTINIMRNWNSQCQIKSWIHYFYFCSILLPKKIFGGCTHIQQQAAPYIGLQSHILWYDYWSILPNLYDLIIIFSVLWFVQSNLKLGL